MFKAQVLLSDELEDLAHKRLEEIRLMHKRLRDEQMAKLAKRKNLTIMEVNAFNHLMSERAKRISIPNLVRSVLARALTEKFEPEVLLTHMERTGTAMGRPVRGEGKLRVVSNRR